MSGKLDQSLDEILSTQRKSAGHRRSTRKPARAATAAPAGGVHKNTKPARGNAAKPASARGTKNTGESKIIVSNLPKDVSESQIKEYFQSAVGGIKRADIVYGPGGVSRGIANVVFHQSDGARKAYQKLNGILVDNRPIKVEVVVTGDAVPEPPSLSQRITQPKLKAQPKSAATDKSSGKGAKPASGTKGAPAKRGRAARPKNARPTKKTADELDAEMADYFDAAKANGEAPAAAAQSADAPMEDEIM
ncbi:hypothetical protein VPNG_05162 [Cytospora leucostoma]|uniref:RRM domain-containing protein n=1 Tax=Cytospora leucostoma TaxID=1230097 RepID=A0A423X478_9PEZI|nr:hypothetical protein VPNG_05162 [Cytospora leucostoma]